MATPEQERRRRWRLVLGSDSQEELSPGLPSGDLLSRMDQGMDRALQALYGEKGAGSLDSSSPQVARWLGDIRSYFPSSSVQVMQHDAFARLNLQQMLLEPELLNAVEHDVHLLATLLSLNKVIPEKTRETARQVVRGIVDEVQRRLRERTIQAVRGSLNRALRNRRPKSAEIDWHRTIRLNLKNYQPERRTIIVDRLAGHGRSRAALRDVWLCVDQSGSMATSLVYASIFGAVLASLPALSTRMIVFDTAVVDLSDDLSDPIDLLFGTQLGGGTDINRALSYCQQQVTRPTQSILFLITDLYEGGSVEGMLRRAAELVASGVQMICLLALSDDGAPSYSAENAATLVSLGIPCFACTPDLFPELLAQAIQKQDLSLWAARQDIVTVQGQ